MTETPVLDKGVAPEGRVVNPQPEVLAHRAASALQVSKDACQRHSTFENCT